MTVTNRKIGDKILEIRINEVIKLGESQLSEKSYCPNGVNLTFRQKLTTQNPEGLISVLQSIANNFNSYSNKSQDTK